MPTSSTPAAALARLSQELAATARATAMLLVQRGHDPAELAALDLRARELRAAIRQAEEAARQHEPVVLTSFSSSMTPPPPAERAAGRKPGGRPRRPRA